MITNSLTMTRLSTARFRIKCFTDPEKTIPQTLELLDLLFIAKVKLSDADADAVFSLDLSDGLEIDEEVVESNELLVTISPSDTAALPVAKSTTLYCELLALGVQRETLGKEVITVNASVKQT